jgi:hypothetical protein
VRGNRERGRAKGGRGAAGADVVQPCPTLSAVSGRRPPSGKQTSEALYSMQMGMRSRAFAESSWSASDLFERSAIMVPSFMR